MPKNPEPAAAVRIAHVRGEDPDLVAFNLAYNSIGAPGTAAGRMWRVRIEVYPEDGDGEES
jgi:hypothetical protein